MLFSTNLVNDIGLGLMLVSIVAVIAAVDSQFINIFYSTSLGSPGFLHIILFISFVVAVTIINTVLLFFTNKNETHATSYTTFLFKFAYVGTSAIQYTIVTILFIIILQIVILHGYNKTFSILVVYLSHLWSIVILGALFSRFIQWFRLARSFSILIYALVFIVILLMIAISVPFLTENFFIQYEFVHLRDYTLLIVNPAIPSANITIIYGVVNYILPILIISSWILTVSLLKSYSGRIGKTKFLLMACVPLVYELFSFVARDAGLVTEPVLLEIVYSRGLQILFAISYQVSGFFFAIAFLIIARKIRRKTMRNYLIISCFGVISLFSSTQPGLPFYAAYPPFGLVTLVFLGLSSYLLLIGILGIARYVSRDAEIRREIYRGLEVDSDMLKNIGIAETQREIERKVLPLTRITDETKESKDLAEEDVKIMIDEVLREIHSRQSEVK
jgi:hypothetical protein